MPAKGVTQPYRVTYSYEGQKPGRIAKGDLTSAKNSATEIARLGGHATVWYVNGDVQNKLSEHPAWTQEQMELRDLANEIAELYLYEDPQRAGHELAERLRRFAKLDGVTF